MLEFFLEPLREPFFQRALLAVFLSGLTCACLGAYVVLRRMAFLSTALTHSILPGVVGAILLGLSPYVGALAAALLTAGGIAWLSARRGTSEDSAIGVMLSVMFAAGIALMSAAQAWRDFTGLLFGSVVSVGATDLLIIALTSAGILFTLRVLHKELELASFDEECLFRRRIRRAHRRATRLAPCRFADPRRPRCRRLRAARRRLTDDGALRHSFRDGRPPRTHITAGHGLGYRVRALRRHQRSIPVLPLRRRALGRWHRAVLCTALPRCPPPHTAALILRFAADVPTAAGPRLPAR